MADALVDAHPLLAYFRPYLGEHLAHDFEDCSPDRVISIGNCDQVVRSVQEYIKTQVPTALVLGGYDESKVGNDRYPGINQYIQ